MKLPKVIHAICWAGLLLFSLGANASYAQSAGLVAFDDLSNEYGEAKVEINLSKQLLGLIGAFSKKENPELSELASNIESITVRVYNITDDAQAALNLIDKTTKHLRKDNWVPIVSVNEEGEKVRIFSKSTGEVMDGMVVMVVDTNSKEAVFINLVGQIDPARINDLTGALNL
ncbi:DUF4252 domain-containing protein [Saccharophagus degradans]|uniref:DUF4252 domain-containing protein n=1 Tax=Saccharophagus degradans (strain 2-40 / ATCC 43961 / DSM 17024) TaxID=203122 RepID=Q21DS7_SACD2|nr:DUF4252 domain-containing protein [Saccharophagus degradans]ABD83152.1 hypothetical protein Sde_3897 [Saccharophagus degradans 2-40]